MAIRVSLPRELTENLESQFDDIFNLICITRNDAGQLSSQISSAEKISTCSILLDKERFASIILRV